MGKTGETTDDAYALLKERVRRYMKHSGESARRLSNRAGLSSYFVGNLLRGRSMMPRPGNLHKLAGAMGTTIEALLNPNPDLAMPWEVRLGPDDLSHHSDERYAEDIFVDLLVALAEVYREEDAEVTVGDLGRLAFREYRLLLETSPTAIECRANIRYIAEQKRRALKRDHTSSLR